LFTHRKYQPMKTILSFAFGFPACALRKVTFASMESGQGSTDFSSQSSTPPIKWTAISLTHVEYEKGLYAFHIFVYFNHYSLLNHPDVTVGALNIFIHELVN